MSTPDRFPATEAPWLDYAPISVQAHVYPRTTLGATVHSGEGRVVLHVEGANRVSVHLFVQRDELARLIDTASAALAELDTATATATAAPAA